MLLLKKAFYLFSWIRYPKITMLKGKGKISRIEALIFFPTRLQGENAMIIINVTIRYTLPMNLQRANAVIIIKCNRQVYSTHEVAKRKSIDYYWRNLQVCSTHEVTESKCSDYY